MARPIWATSSDMGMEVQAQFFKVLEDKSYRRLGDVKLFKSYFD